MLQVCYRYARYATGMLDMLQACYRYARYATGMLQVCYPVINPFLWWAPGETLHYTYTTPHNPHPVASGLGPISVGPYTHYGPTH